MLLNEHPTRPRLDNLLAMWQTILNIRRRISIPDQTNEQDWLDAVL